LGVDKQKKLSEVVFGYIIWDN